MSERKMQETTESDYFALKAKYEQVVDANAQQEESIKALTEYDRTHW